MQQPVSSLRTAEPPKSHFQQLHLRRRPIATGMHPARGRSHPQPSRTRPHGPGIPGTAPQLAQRDGRVRPAVGQLRPGPSAVETAGRIQSRPSHSIRKSPGGVHLESHEFQSRSWPACGSAAGQVSQLGVVSRPASRSLPAGQWIGPTGPARRSGRIHNSSSHSQFTKAALSSHRSTPVNARLNYY